MDRGTAGSYAYQLIGAGIEVRCAPSCILVEELQQPV